MLNSGKKFALCATKKINILTLVLSKKKFLNETKNHIGGGNWRTRKKPPTCRKSLTNIITSASDITRESETQTIGTHEHVSNTCSFIKCRFNQV